MKKLSLLFATILLAGCGSIADLSVTPASIYTEQGHDKAVEWCQQREQQLATAAGVGSLVGAFVDVPIKVLAAPVEAFVGPVIEGTTVIRDQQCKVILSQ